MTNKSLSELRLMLKGVSWAKFLIQGNDGRVASHLYIHPKSQIHFRLLIGHGASPRPTIRIIAQKKIVALRFISQEHFNDWSAMTWGAGRFYINAGKVLGPIIPDDE